MKKLRWSTTAADDLREIRERIARDNPETARKAVKTIHDGLQTLKRFPYQGRPGVEVGSRELTFAGLPYIAVYRVTPTHVEISRIWHGAQNRS